VSKRVEALRVPPHAIDAEESVLGACMLDETAIGRIDWLREEDFYRKDHRLIYRALCELSSTGKPCDAVTMGEWFESNGMAEMVGGTARVIQLANSTPSAANIHAYAEIVLEKSRLRQLIDAGTSLASAGFDPRGQDSSTIASHAANVLGALVSDPRAGGLEGISTASRQWFETMTRRYENKDKLIGLETPFWALNRLTKGLQPGWLIIIGGRPGMGKTVLMENLGRFAALKNEPTAVFSMEMRRGSLMDRTMSAMSEIDHERLSEAWKLSEDEWALLTDKQKLINAAPMYIDDTPGLSAEQIVARAKRQHMRRPLKLVMIDNISRLSLPKRANKTDEIGDALKTLDNAAKKYGWTLILLAHLNRPSQDRKDHRPTLNDLRGSGDIEQDADLVLFLHREDYYNRKSHLKGVVELIPSKGRDLNTSWLPAEQGMQPCILLENCYSTMRLESWNGALPDPPPPSA